MPTLARFAERLTTPLLPADYLDVINPLLSAAALRGRITAVLPETADAATVVIRPGRGWPAHTPGQYLRLGVDVDGVRHWRAYSITSAADRCVTITVKAVPGGRVSEHLVRRAAIGTLVHLQAPAGDFTLDAAPGAAVLFVTAGSGITPVMGMLRGLAPSAVRDIVVVHSAPSAAEVIFGAELRRLAADGRIRLVEVHTRTDGRLDAARLDVLVPDWRQRHTFACGPAELLDDLERRWAAEQLTGRLHVERFRTAFTALGEGGRATFSTTGATVDADGATSLLETGESAGVLMPSGCRMGICFGCVAPLRAGAVRDLRSGEITTAGDGVLVQTCVSAAAGDCDIEL